MNLNINEIYSTHKRIQNILKLKIITLGKYVSSLGKGGLN